MQGHDHSGLPHTEPGNHTDLRKTISSRNFGLQWMCSITSYWYSVQISITNTTTNTGRGKMGKEKSGNIEPLAQQILWSLSQNVPLDTHSRTKILKKNTLI